MMQLSANEPFSPTVCRSLLEAIDRFISIMIHKIQLTIAKAILRYFLLEYVIPTLKKVTQPMAADIGASTRKKAWP